MYPLNMKLVDGVGFAVANDKAEHQALTRAGYGPAYVAPTKGAKGDASDGQAPTPAPDGQ
jgi:hypothetical protein